MSQSLTLELPEEIYQAVMRAAEATGKAPAEWIATRLPELLPVRMAQGMRSIMELHGLGAEMWDGIDTQEYVDGLRSEWDRRS